MLVDRIEHRWIEAFAATLRLCDVAPGLPVAILSESQSRALNRQLAELAVQRLGGKPVHLQAVTPTQREIVPIRSTGASIAIDAHPGLLAALKAVPMIVDLTVEGLMHAPELGEILESGARVLTISNEHPDALERLVPDIQLEPAVRAAARRCREATRMTVSSPLGTSLAIDLEGARTVGIWGYTAKPGTLAHWPGGLVVAFPKAGSVSGELVMDAGDINLTFKRYLAAPVRLRIEDDFVVDVSGGGADAEMMRRYLAAFDEANAYAVSHVGFGMNEKARYEALACYDQRDTNGTELRAYAGNFLFSTGANEFAGRFTSGHFDLPVRGCTICLDDLTVVADGQVVWDAFSTEKTTGAGQ
ncbi:MAG: peptidase M29 [Geminicoccaceae bacterium]